MLKQIFLVVNYKCKKKIKIKLTSLVLGVFMQQRLYLIIFNLIIIFFFFYKNYISNYNISILVRD